MYVHLSQALDSCGYFVSLNSLESVVKFYFIVGFLHCQSNKGVNL